jgi:hypothetical protein
MRTSGWLNRSKMQLSAHPRFVVAGSCWIWDLTRSTKVCKLFLTERFGSDKFRSTQFSDIFVQFLHAGFAGIECSEQKRVHLKPEGGSYAR